MLSGGMWRGYHKRDERSNGELWLAAMSSVTGREVTGGRVPGGFWRKFMKEATEGMDTGTFDLPTSFPGREIGSERQPTTTTTEPSTTTTSVYDTTTTTSDATTTATVASPSTTEAPPETTTTAAPPTTLVPAQPSQVGADP